MLYDHAGRRLVRINRFGFLQLEPRFEVARQVDALVFPEIHLEDAVGSALPMAVDEVEHDWDTIDKQQLAADRRACLGRDAIHR